MNGGSNWGAPASHTEHRADSPVGKTGRSGEELGTRKTERRFGSSSGRLPGSRYPSHHSTTVHTHHTSVSMSQRTAGGLVRIAAPAVNTQELSGRVEHPHTLVLADQFRVRAVRTCVLCLGRPTPLSRYSRGSCTFVPRSELNSRNARVPFVAIHRCAHHDAHHDGMACAPRAGPNLVAAKVPLMLTTALNPPRRRAHDGAPSAPRRPRLRRPLRRHPRRQRPRWWRLQRGAAAAARRAGWRCGYRVRYTRRS